MTPEELDRALVEALDVGPPAGYVARVRARVAAEQTASAGRHAWWPLGAMAAGVLVLAAGGLILERESTPQPLATLTSHAPGNVARDGSHRDAEPARQGVDAERSGGEPPAAPRGERTSASSVVGSRGPGRTPDALPAVLISPEDSAGLQFLATFTAATVAAPGAGRDEPATLLISRIDVALIDVDSPLELTPLALGELQ